MMIRFVYPSIFLYSTLFVGNVSRFSDKPTDSLFGSKAMLEPDNALQHNLWMHRNTIHFLGEKVLGSLVPVLRAHAKSLQAITCFV